MEKISFRLSGLPTLPKKNKKKEADFGLVFRAYIEKNWPKHSAQFELKDTRGKNVFPFDEVEEAQVRHALRSKTKKGNLIRIINGTQGAPDYVYFKECQNSFIVIRYPSHKGYIIDIDDFINEKERSSRKSLTEERAEEISTRVI